MADLQQVKDALDALQASVDEKQAAISASLADLHTQITTLQDQINQGGTVSAADLDAVLDKVNTIKADVDSTATT